MSIVLLSKEVQTPLFVPESDWRSPALGDLPDWGDAKRVAIDTETYDPFLKQLGPSVRRGGYVVGYSFAIEDGPSYYVPLRHDGGDNVDDPEMGAQYLRDQGKKFKGILIGANIQYDLDYLAEIDIEFPNVEFFRDVLLAAPLIDELQGSYSLDAVAGRHDLGSKDEDLLKKAAAAYGVDPKAGLWKLPARFVGKYGAQDARLPLSLLRRQERIIDEQDLWDAYNLESRVMPVLLRMKRRGIRIDEEKLEAIEEWSIKQEKGCLGEIYRLTNKRVEIDTIFGTRVVAPILVDIGMKLDRTPTGKPRVNKDALAAFDHPVAKMILRARKVNKLRTTFAASIRRFMVDGRVHCNFNQMARQKEDGNVGGARYGRMSSTNPNMQQQPSKDDFAKEWRSIYIPEEGAELCSCDYSQQEPRMLTHYAVLAGCRGAREVAKQYHDNRNLDNHQMMADLTGLERKFAKIIYLGLCYGMKGGKLALSLGLPAEKKIHPHSGREFFIAGPEARVILERFNGRVPFLKQLAKMCEYAAQERGYIKLIDGRRCRFPQSNDSGYDFTHKALNRIIQGGAAIQMKIAMVYIDAAGIFVQLQIHDELISSIGDRNDAIIQQNIMQDCVSLAVPSKVDIEIGPSWGESMK